MTETDIPSMMEILEASGLCEREGLQERLAACLARSPDTCFASEDGGRISGVLLASYNGFHVFLSHIAIAPTHQRKRMGAALHARLVERGRELGATGIITDSRITTTPFFFAQGYRLPGAVFMIKDL